MLTVLFIASLLAMATDAVTTTMAIRQGFKEGNPVIAWAFGEYPEPWELGVAKLPGAAVCAGAYAYGVWPALAVLIVIHVALVVHNFRKLA
jgi:hypothetical protein